MADATWLAPVPNALEPSFDRQRGIPLGSPIVSLQWRMKWIELGFCRRPLSQSELDGDVVEPAWREAAILVAQPGHDNPDHGNANIRPRLIKDEKIECMALGERYAGMHLLAPTQARETRGPGEPGDGSTMPAQKGMIAQRQ